MAVKKGVKKASKATKKVTKPATKKVAKKANKKVAKPQKTTAKKVAKTTKAKKKVTKKVAKKVVKKPTKKVAKKKVAKKVLSKAAKDQEKRAKILLQMGRDRGYVTYDDIMKQFPTLEKDVPFIDDLYERLATAHVDILSSGGLLGEDQSEGLLAQKNAYRRNDSSYDSIQMYLREIGQYPLLTAQQERDLAKRIEDGDEEARNLLARANLRLVVSIA